MTWLAAMWLWIGALIFVLALLDRIDRARVAAARRAWGHDDVEALTRLPDCDEGGEG